MIGLIGAAESYRENRGCKPDTWFSLRINGSILDGIRDHDRVKKTVRGSRKKKGLPEIGFSSLSGDDDHLEVFRSDEDPTLSAEQDDLLDYLMSGMSPRNRLIMTLAVRRGLTLKRIGKRIASLYSDGSISETRVWQIWHREIMPHVKARAKEMAA